MGCVAAVFEHGRGFRTSRRQHHVAPDTHGVARKACGFGVRHDEASPCIHPVRDRGLGIGVERGRIVQQFAVAERTEAGIQVIEPARDEFQGQYFFAVDVAQHAMGFDVATLPVPPEPGIREAQHVPRSFEITILFQADYAISVFAEPSCKVFLFSPAFRMPEPADDGRTVVHHAGIGGEHQVGQARNGRHPFEFGAGVLFQHVGEGPPLGLAHVLVDGVGQTHPRIDFILDPEVIRWANQEACHDVTPAGRGPGPVVAGRMPHPSRGRWIGSCRGR